MKLLILPLKTVTTTTTSKPLKQNGNCTWETTAYYP